MAKEEGIELSGKVVKCEKSMFLVECSQKEGVSHIVSATIGGRLRKNYIRIVVGDLVDVVVSPYDPYKGRITYRKK